MTSSRLVASLTLEQSLLSHSVQAGSSRPASEAELTWFSRGLREIPHSVLNSPSSFVSVPF